MARFSDAMVDAISARFKALGEPMRLRILDALRRRPLTVGELVAATGATQANISKHLAVLHREAFLTRRRDGLHVYYAIKDPAVFGLCETVCGPLAEQAQTRARALRPARRAG